VNGSEEAELALGASETIFFLSVKPSMRSLPDLC